MYKNFSKEDLYDLLRAYDVYIYKAFDSRIIDTGWQPCCVEEFYENEYQNVWKNRDSTETADYSCFDYMYSE